MRDGPASTSKDFFDYIKGKLAKEGGPSLFGCFGYRPDMYPLCVLRLLKMSSEIKVISTPSPPTELLCRQDPVHFRPRQEKALPACLQGTKVNIPTQPPYMFGMRKEVVLLDGCVQSVQGCTCTCVNYVFILWLKNGIYMHTKKHPRLLCLVMRIAWGTLIIVSRHHIIRAAKVFSFSRSNVTRDRGVAICVLRRVQ